MTTALSRRNKITEFAEKFEKLPGVKKGDMEECPLKHKFADGIYVREIFIPKGMLIVSKIHKHSHPNFLLKGRISVYTEELGEELLVAPLSIISPAGTRRVLYTHEDTVWITVHKTDKKDLGEIEKEIIIESYDLLEDDPTEVKLMR